MVFGTPATDKSIVQGCTQFCLGHRRRQQIVPGHLTTPGKHIYEPGSSAIIQARAAMVSTAGKFESAYYAE